MVILCAKNRQTSDKVSDAKINLSKFSICLKRCKVKCI